MLQVIRGLPTPRGVGQISPATIAAASGNISGFHTPRQPMGSSRVVPSEDSSGKRTPRGGIPKTGCARCGRRIAPFGYLGAKMR